MTLLDVEGEFEGVGLAVPHEERKPERVCDTAGERDDVRVAVSAALGEEVPDGDGETLVDLEIEGDAVCEPDTLTVLDTAGDRDCVRDAEDDLDAAGDALSVFDVDGDRVAVPQTEALGEGVPDSERLGEPELVRDTPPEAVLERVPLPHDVPLRDELTDPVGELVCEADAVTEGVRDADPDLDALADWHVDAEVLPLRVADGDEDGERDACGERLTDCDSVDDTDADVVRDTPGDADAVTVPLAVKAPLSVMESDTDAVADGEGGSGAVEYDELAMVAVRDANVTLVRGLALVDQLARVLEGGAESEGERDAETDGVELGEPDALRDTEVVAEEHGDLAGDALRSDERDRVRLPEGELEALAHADADFDAPAEGLLLPLREGLGLLDGVLVPLPLREELGEPAGERVPLPLREGLRLLDGDGVLLGHAVCETLARGLREPLVDELGAVDAEPLRDDVPQPDAVRDAQLAQLALRVPLTVRERAPDAEGHALAEPLRELLSVTDGDAEALLHAEGRGHAVAAAEGDTDPEGLRDPDTDADGEREADACREVVGDTDGHEEGVVVEHWEVVAVSHADGLADVDTEGHGDAVRDGKVLGVKLEEPLSLREPLGDGDARGDVLGDPEGV